MVDSKMAYGARAAMEPVLLRLEYSLGEEPLADSGASSGNRLKAPVMQPRRMCVSEEPLSGNIGVFEEFFELMSDDSRDEGGDASADTVGDAAGYVRVAFDGEVLSVRIEPKRELRLRSLRVELRHAFASDELVLLNGYQSWTRTAELSAWSRMGGKQSKPKTLAHRPAPDEDGDYGFASYAPRRGRMHGFSYATFRRGDGMVLVGSLDETRGFTLIRTDARAGCVALETECPQRPLLQGEVAELARYAITRGSMGTCYDRWFELAGIRVHDVRPLVGYTSWYRHYDAIDEEKLLGDLDGVTRALSKLGGHALDGVLKVFQIDGGYCPVGDWLDVDALRFPRGLVSLAGRIRDAGFVPGLWIAPFVCERNSRLFRERSEWLLRDDRGDLLMARSHWSGGYVLDTRNVEVRSYILNVLQTITREWGFSLLKADILHGACMMEHAGLNRGELMSDAIDLLRKGAGEQTLIIGSGVPLASAFGKLDYCRIGCSVCLDWNGGRHARLSRRDRASARYSLSNTYARAPLDGRAFGNDPDVFYLRPDVRLSDGQRFERLVAYADLGHVLLTSDDMDTWTPPMRERYARSLEALAARCKVR